MILLTWCWKAKLHVPPVLRALLFYRTWSSKKHIQEYVSKTTLPLWPALEIFCGMIMVSYLYLVPKIGLVLTCGSRDIHVNTQKNQKCAHYIVWYHFSYTVVPDIFGNFGFSVCFAPKFVNRIVCNTILNLNWPQPKHLFGVNGQKDSCTSLILLGSPQAVCPSST